MKALSKIGNIPEPLHATSILIESEKRIEIHTDSPVTVSPLLYNSVELEAVTEAVEVKLGDSEELLLPGETEAAG